MKMRLIAVLALSALGAGCGIERMTPNQMADYATRELGVPVFLWGRAGDVCLTRQIKSFYDEYAKADAKGKKAMGDKLARSYGALIINASENAGTIQKITYELQLHGSSCGGLSESQCNSEQVAHRLVRDWKQSSDWHTFSGKYPGTRIEKGEELTLTPVSSYDISKKRTFATWDADLYRNMGSDSYVDIESSYNFGTISLVSEVKADPVNCGKLAGFKDLF
jgi:hypothetical protein